MNDTLAELQEEILSPDTAWAAAGFVAAVLGAAIGRKLLKGGWRQATGKEPPLNPGLQDTTWVAAIAWGVVSGALIGVVRAASRHGASSARRRWT